MSRLNKIVSERNAANPSTSIDDLAPAQELSMSELNRVVAGGEVIRGGTIVVKGGCGDGSVDHVNKTCDE